MKKAALKLSIVSLLLTSTVFAQDKKLALGLGFEPSLNWMKTKSDGLSSQGARPGFGYGLLADINFGENYAWATGLFINNYGGRVKATYAADSTVQDMELDVRMQSIRIPLTLRMSTKEIGYFRYYGLFGFDLDVLINGRADQKFDGGPEDKNRNVKSDLAPANFSLVLGVGAMYNLSGTTNFVVGLSYRNGFINVFDMQTADGTDLNATTNQIALNLGVLF